MMNSYRSILFFCLAALSASSCSRTEEEPKSVGGKGGNATLKITPKHHDLNIDSCMVYIKYDAQDVPASYDDSAKAVMINNIPVATFAGLKKGAYYLFGKGWDASIKD